MKIRPHTSYFPSLESIAKPWQEDQVKRVAGHYAKVSEGRKQTLVPAEPWHSGKQEVRPSGVVVAHARPARRSITTGGSNFAALASQIYADAGRNKVARSCVTFVRPTSCTITRPPSYRYRRYAEYRQNSRGFEEWRPLIRASVSFILLFLLCALR